VRWLREPEPTFEAIISYADSAAGHHGGVYHAASWGQLGMLDDPRSFWERALKVPEVLGQPNCLTLPDCFSAPKGDAHHNPAGLVAALSSWGLDNGSSVLP